MREKGQPWHEKASNRWPETDKPILEYTEFQKYKIKHIN